MHGRWLRLSLPLRAGAAFCWCGLLMLAGCGGKAPPYSGKLIPVQGKVTTVDGKPLSGGHVTFVLSNKDSDAASANSEGVIGEVSGSIGEDGSYTLYTQGKPGAPPGKYKVVFRAGSNRKVWLPVSNLYFGLKKTPLEREVADGKPAGYYDLKLETRNK